MKKKLLATFLSIPLLFFIIWTGYLEYQKQTGDLITLPIRKYYTNNFLSSSFLYYEVDWENAKCERGNCDYLNKDAFCQKRVYGVCENHFYIPKKYAYNLDRLFYGKDKNNMKLEIVYSYTGKTSYATQLLINGKDYKEFMTKD